MVRESSITGGDGRATVVGKIASADADPQLHDAIFGMLDFVYGYCSQGAGIFDTYLGL